ncbi:MmgE/PrpD family protein [Candidatus Solincola tengchongensis]|uniref:MmgE/PrpD family protein n=1 Tax=Candidatus Solincola tengchongensis TaxID=2900693 RepID=UPI00257F43E7|nr:MmgE/PrpD family protein [Candidatus Solincola tengchongensis]
MKIPVTEILCEWACRTTFEDIPPRTVRCAKEQVLSIVAAMLAGSRADFLQPLYRAARSWGDREEATVVGGGFRSSMRTAGMVNAVAAQALEWEDYLKSQHSGASTVPAALAVAEGVGASGRDFLTALVIGNEISGRTGQAYIRSRLFTNSCPNHQIDAAVVAGKLMGLDREAMMDAVGIACFPPFTQCFAGWMSGTKGMITGAPVLAGITAASLAAHGMHGFRGIIEHPDGFSNALFERYDLEEMVRGLGEEWRTDTHSPKLYPCCGWLDALVDSALDLLEEHSLTWRDIRKVEVRCPTVTLLLRRPVEELLELMDRIAAEEWLTPMPLFFDATYPLAVAIMDRELTAAQFERGRMKDPELRRFLGRFSYTADPLLDWKEMEEGVNAGEVTFLLRDGRRVSRFTEAMKGSYLNPLDVREKLAVCTRGILDEARREEIAGAVDRLEEFDDLRDFARLL